MQGWPLTNRPYDTMPLYCQTFWEQFMERHNHSKNLTVHTNLHQVFYNDYIEPQSIIRLKIKGNCELRYQLALVSSFGACKTLDCTYGF